PRALGSPSCNAATGLPLAADEDDGLVGPLAVYVPEFLEVRLVEIGELLAGVGKRGRELLRLHRLADRAAQRRHDRRRRAFRREEPDPEIVFDVVAEFLERRHIGQHPRRARAAETGQRTQLAGLDMR